VPNIAELANIAEFANIAEIFGQKLSAILAPPCIKKNSEKTSENYILFNLYFSHELCNRIEEQEEDLEETMQKYKQSVEQYNRNQTEIVNLTGELESVKSEKYMLEERVRTLQLSNEHYESNYVDKTQIVRAEARARFLSKITLSFTVILVGVSGSLSRPPILARQTLELCQNLLIFWL
jgi:DNA repair exonuclease SbcCD ATPase subunit